MKMLSSLISVNVGRTPVAFLAVLFGLFVLPIQAATPTSKPTEPRTAKVRIVLAGDSTVNAGTGWGAAFTQLLSDDVECVNYALNGRSTLSYINEGAWKKCLAAKPDWVLIQFGHNDQKKEDPKRFTDPETTYKQYLGQMIDEAKTAGIKPVLITSLARRRFGPNGKMNSDLLDYVNAAKQVAADKGVVLLDLHARSVELYDKLGKDECERQISARTKDGAVDNTHLSDTGAPLIAALVAAEIQAKSPELAALLK